MKIKLTFTEFTDLALEKLKEKHKELGDMGGVEFYRQQFTEPDRECIEIPDYVMVDVNDKR